MLMPMRCQLLMQKLRLKTVSCLLKRSDYRPIETLPSRIAYTSKTYERRTIWVRQWLARRPGLAKYAQLMNELKKAYAS
ncbi:hypothetical protein DPMN_025913 [Dreissena polymorpha]|uniref:Uncharacterized protein n=1 Tax=Dreissena polymorpha TaxID=45954 RepID=A0A9D4LSD6_DREPO|nr:hypothetical protein DPMN_025913 [Dreissena polymorpha]